jgi:hypothetical protein
VEGLGEVVVCAAGQAPDPLGGQCARGEHDDAHVGVPRVASEALADVDAVVVGHHQVQHDEVGAERLDQVEGFATRARGLDLVAVAGEGDPDEVRDVGLVVDDEHPCRGTGRGAFGYHALPESTPKW